MLHYRMLRPLWFVDNEFSVQLKQIDRYCYCKQETDDYIFLQVLCHCIEHYCVNKHKK